MLDAVLVKFLTSITEREFDAPFMALLRSLGFYDIHFVHGPYEFGKDFIAKRASDGIIFQYVFQSKRGDIATADWDKGVGQLDRLRRSGLAHPAFDTTAPRRAVLLLTGRLVGAGAINAQEYCRDLEERNEVRLEIWDRERLVELIREGVTIGLADRTEGPLLGILANIEARNVTDRDLEKFSRRWYADAQVAWPCALEAAVVAIQLEATNRADLACYVGLALVRAAWRQTHCTDRIADDWSTTADLGRLIFATYADILWERRSSGAVFEPRAMIEAHEEPAALVTDAVRCVRLAEFLALRALMPAIDGHGGPSREAIAHWLADFVGRQRAAAFLISDRWAVALIPPVLLLSNAGFRDKVGEHLRAVTKWIGDRYGEGVGLASWSATPDEEVRQLVGNVVPPRDVARRPESYVATVLLDLAAFVGLTGTYKGARHEFHAVEALPSVLTTEDSGGQYILNGVDTSREPNAPYRDELTGDWTDVAPHLKRASAPRYLQTIGRSWDHMAVSAVLRDRHFVSAWKELR